MLNLKGSSEDSACFMFFRFGKVPVFTMHRVTGDVARLFRDALHEKMRFPRYDVRKIESKCECRGTVALSD